MKAYWFSNKEKKLAYNDNRSIVVGKTHIIEGKPICCENGLHGSIRLIDALEYAKSGNLYLVEIEGDIDSQEDKICGTSRTYIASANIEDILSCFARQQALINIDKVKPYCTEQEFSTINKWLKTGDKSIKSAARSAARAAARAAADSAADSAARSAAWAAARAAAWLAWSAADSAAYSAAYSAAGSAARAAARAAAWLAADSAAYSAAYSAAGSAAWAAARAAARTEQDDMLTAMVREQTGWDI